MPDIAAWAGAGALGALEPLPSPPRPGPSLTHAAAHVTVAHAHAHVFVVAAPKTQNIFSAPLPCEKKIPLARTFPTTTATFFFLRTSATSSTYDAYFSINGIPATKQPELSAYFSPNTPWRPPRGKVFCLAPPEAILNHHKATTASLKGNPTTAIHPRTLAT